MNQKVTVYLPSELVVFADEEASRQHTSRSHVVSQALARLKGLVEEQVAIEGYLYYAKEAAEFASSITTNSTNGR
jgi:hypothetical protein